MIKGVRPTLYFGNVQSKLIALFQHALSSLLDKGVEFGRKLGHAVAQIVKPKVDAWERVGDGWSHRRHCLSIGVGGE